MYIITIFVLLAIYVLGIILLKKINNQRLINLILPLTAFFLYLVLALIIYLDVGFDDWNFRNVLPTANVSPFIFFVSPFCLLLPKKIRVYFFSLISLLSLGMLVSPILSCIYNASIAYKFHPHFLLDYFAHLSIALWGVYLFVSQQTVVKKCDFVKSGLIIIGVSLVMLILNIIFDQAFFGLSLNGKHNIYNMALVDSSYLSALIYFAGLCLVLFLGYLYLRILLRILQNK